MRCNKQCNVVVDCESTIPALKMNVKVTVTLPLAVILFISDIYCPPTEENEFPSRYELQSCVSESEYIQIDSPGSTFEITQSRRNSRKYCLIQTLSDGSRGREYCFRKRDVEFIWMKDAELKMIIYPFDSLHITWNLTCVYPSVELARVFYKDMTRAMHYELSHFLEAVSLKNSANIVLVDRPNIFVDCFANYVTIVVKNAEDEVVIIFPANNISTITHTIVTEINVRIRLNVDYEVLYTFDCADDSDATALRELLNRLLHHTGGTSAQFGRRPYDDPFVESLFAMLELKLQERIRRTSRLLLLSGDPL